MLSLALNYHFSQLNPFGYYLTNVLLHVLNVALIFFATRKLLEAMVKVGYKPMPIIPWLVAAGALLHGIHPMHVESVAWLAERKDVLYCVFYFIGLMMYVDYLEGKRFPWMLYVNSVLALLAIVTMVGLKDFSLHFKNYFAVNDSIICGVALLMLGAAIYAEVKFKSQKLGLYYVFEFFIFSLFSKPLAVAFSLSIVAVDILLKRDVKFYKAGASWIANEIRALFNLVLEKWMFFVLALLSGLQSAYLQNVNKTLVFTHGYSIVQKLQISCYTFMMYSYKAVWPALLCGYYPFPGVDSNHNLPTIFFIAPVIAISIITVPIILAYKNKDLLRVVIFGLAFYFANLLFVLQFVSAGTTIISERYSYVSYFGLFFIVVYMAHWFWYKNKSSHLVIQGSLGIILVVCGYLSMERTKAWHNPETFWSDIISKSNAQSQLPYLNLGDYLADSGKYDKAYTPYITLLHLHTDQAGVYRNLGNIYGMRKQFDSSIYCFTMAIKYDSSDASIYNNLGVTYANLGKFNLAINDFRKAYKLDTTQDGVLTEIARTEMQLGQLNPAVADYGKLIQKAPKEPSNYLMRGNCLLNGGNPEQASKDYLKVVELQPDNGEAMYDLSVCYDKLHHDSEALKYAMLANQNKFQVPVDYLNRLQKSAR